jgi:putative ABC transport system permease protein
MKSIYLAFRTLFRKGRNNVIKIISLSVGLAMAMVLIAKIHFEQSFNNFFPDAERIYQVRANYVMGDKTVDGIQYISGGVIAGMNDVMPEIEAGTRYTAIGSQFLTEDGREYDAGDIVLADTSLFDVLSRPILAGDARQTLARPMYAMVSSEVADMLGGVDRAMGQVIHMRNRPDETITIGGVFKALPENTHLDFGVVVSLTSIERFTGDGTQNWYGNERYGSYAKLRPGIAPESLRPGIDRVREKYLDKAILSEANLEIDYAFFPLTQVHTSSKEVEQMMWLLGILAFALLFASVMNYLLVIISSLVNRSKEMAVYKCYGASGANIYGRMTAETFVDLLASLLVSAGLIYAFRGVILSVLGTEVHHLFTPGSVLLLAGVCLVVFLVSSLVPGYLYARIPVATAFRRFSESRRYWKLGLLFIQFMAVGFFITLLAIIMRQYNYMINDDPGYACDNLAYCSLPRDPDLRRRTIDEISRMPEVARTSATSMLLFFGHPGNNIKLPGGDHYLFNVADNESVGDGYFDVMEIPVIDGRTFTEGVEDSREVMVSRSFVERMKAFADWPDGAVGKDIIITAHSRSDDMPFTICGVYEDIRLGIIGRQDDRPSIMFYSKNSTYTLLIKFHHQTPEAMAKVSALMASLRPDENISVYSYAAEIVTRYDDSRKFRDSVMISGLVTLLISLIGLLGYTGDEMNRRRKEIAIRKINGATVAQVLRLFLTAILRMALPALALGCTVAWYISGEWLKQFADKASLPFMLFLACGCTLLAVIIVTVGINCYRTANENPAVSIKSE